MLFKFPFDCSFLYTSPLNCFVYALGSDKDDCAASDSGLPASKLIHPLSKFGLAWVSANCIFLAYIAVVTPPMIALYWLDDPCQAPPTIFFDTALDAFFLLDILMNFLTGMIQAGTYHDDFQTVSHSYLKGYFLFDVVTSIPVSFFELIATAQCGATAAAEAAGGTVDAEDTRYFQKALRLQSYTRREMYDPTE
jgi:hypothetical protein